jgi:hypothetical protein
MRTEEIKHIRGLLSKAGYTEPGNKEDQCMFYSKGRTISLKAMHHAETQDMIRGLKEELGMVDVSPDQKMRRKIISMAHEMGLHIPGTNKIDMVEVNNWCINKSGHKKPLNDLNHFELTKAVTTYSMLYAAYLKGI